MRIRGEITHSEMEWATDPNRALEYKDLIPPSTPPPLNRELHLPYRAYDLAVIRQNISQFPEGVTLDAYQSITELELKHPKGAPVAKDRYFNGLRDEIREATSELYMAQIENPTNFFIDHLDGENDLWMVSIMDPRRLTYRLLTPERKEKYMGELGDILWYSARLADEYDVPLSAAFMRFLNSANCGTLPLEYSGNHVEEAESRGSEILDFDVVQAISGSQKNAIKIKTMVGTPDESTVTIATSPYSILHRIHDDDLSYIPRSDEDVEKLAITIGKLVWFMAYTSGSILNAEFSTVMQANLQKITARSARGTIFSKSDRNNLDEAQIRASVDPREPIKPS